MVLTSFLSIARSATGLHWRQAQGGRSETHPQDADTAFRLGQRAFRHLRRSPQRRSATWLPAPRNSAQGASPVASARSNCPLRNRGQGRKCRSGPLPSPFRGNPERLQLLGHRMCSRSSGVQRTRRVSGILQAKREGDHRQNMTSGGF